MTPSFIYGDLITVRAIFVTICLVPLAVLAGFAMDVNGEFISLDINEPLDGERMTDADEISFELVDVQTGARFSGDRELIVPDVFRTPGLDDDGGDNGTAQSTEETFNGYPGLSALVAGGIALFAFMTLVSIAVVKRLGQRANGADQPDNAGRGPVASAESVTRPKRVAGGRSIRQLRPPGR